MYPGQRRSTRWSGLLAPVLAVSARCLGNRAQIEQALNTYRPPSAHLSQIASNYRSRCSDLLQVEVSGLPRYSGPHRIGPDGRIDLSDAGQPQLEGATVPEIVRTVAESIGVPPERVQVWVAEHNSQYLYLFGRDRRQRARRALSGLRGFKIAAGAAWPPQQAPRCQAHPG